MVVLIFAKCLLSWLLMLFMFCDGGLVSRVRLLAFPGTDIVSPWLRGCLDLCLLLFWLVWLLTRWVRLRVQSSGDLMFKWSIRSNIHSTIAMWSFRSWEQAICRLKRSSQPVSRRLWKVTGLGRVLVESEVPIWKGEMTGRMSRFSDGRSGRNRWWKSGVPS